ncbi:MAG: N-acetylmuramoyl-L-alanine amidase [Treponema sp.]|jgi:N-acetylmuramoyl-L-alanine amidase|nr:N-acetylmuramoyl-L-alanine amidase [Treponema sp.]
MKRFVMFLSIIYIFFMTALLAAQTGERPRTLTLDETLTQLNTVREGETATFRWDPFFQSGTFSVANHYVIFEAGQAGETGLALVDGAELISLPAPYLAGEGQLWFPEGFVVKLKDSLDVSIKDERVLFRIAAIIIDPGHGGKDTGALATHTINGKSTRVVEKDITLSVSLDLHERLASAYPDKQILLTRKTDVYLSLEERVNRANAVRLKDNEAIIYISVHANASFNKSVRGYEVWYLPPDYQRTVIDSEKFADSRELIPIFNAMLQEEFTMESITMGRSILKSFDELLGKTLPSRGIKAEEWFVVRNARMPAVLVELGFVSNATDAGLLTDDTHLKNFSQALYKGIMDFVTSFERSGGLITVE